MALIQIYLDKSDDSSRQYIELLRNKNIDFLQTNLKNETSILKLHKLSSLPAIRFQNSLIYDITEKSVHKIVKKFNQYVYNLTDLGSNQKILNNFKKSIEQENSKENKFKKANTDKIRIGNLQKFLKLTKTMLKPKK
ncbi:hypothetical protein [Candidatus Arthromitus sp. SFB-rat-Yit]|uniref:hypothetical protein n=1 Tax=Candidatus Arthromitus sp. SFB-rat-Yit TaxID=1041504 RepID=UPI000227A316|nr:hypothetical protein [Candidatus Arthromitus sp. SFB-rat-Yit]BAK81456.1 hypothetical protein RATSFB_0894 [Candidatus Arthromitus sp. SFB-rat-Yit]